MPKQCPVCVHSERQDIEKALLGSETLHQITQRYGVSRRSLFNHKHNHLPATLLKAQEAQEIVMADSLIDQLKQLHLKALELLDKAEAAGDLRTALQGIREARGCLELFLKAFEAANLEARVSKLENKVWGD